MEALEKSLDRLFKKLPQIPESGRKMIADILPWAALVGGVLSFIGAWTIFRLTSAATNLAYMYYATSATGIAAFVWIGLIMMLAQAVLFLVAFPALRTFKKSGWRLLFYAMLINALYDILFYGFAGAFDLGSLVVNLLFAVAGVYVLFQVRGHFGGAAPVANAEKPAETSSKK